MNAKFGPGTSTASSLPPAPNRPLQPKPQLPSPHQTHEIAHLSSIALATEDHVLRFTLHVLRPMLLTTNYQLLTCLEYRHFSHRPRNDLSARNNPVMSSQP